MISGCPFLVQVTVVAGEPEVVQVRLEDVLEAPVAIIKSFVVELATMVGGAEGRKRNYIKNYSKKKKLLYKTHC